MHAAGALLAATSLVPAAAQRPGPIPPDAAGEQDAAGAALVDAFGKFCLERFPAPAHMEDAALGQVTAVPPAMVQRFLHDDPGHAWRYVANGATYIVTVEDPPYHTCAVRSMYATQPGYHVPWLLTTELWAASAGRQFGPSQAQSSNQGGLQIDAQMRSLPGAGGDVFMEIKTVYPDGRVEERLARRSLAGAKP